MSSKEDQDVLNPLLEELEGWQDIIQSEAWRYFKDVMGRHREYCEREALLHIKKNDMVGANRAQAKAEDAETIFELVKARIRELNEEVR